MCVAFALPLKTIAPRVQRTAFSDAIRQVAKAATASVRLRAFVEWRWEKLQLFCLHFFSPLFCHLER